MKGNTQWVVLKRGVSSNSGNIEPPDSATSSPSAKRPCFLTGTKMENAGEYTTIDIQMLEDNIVSTDGGSVVTQLQNLTTEDAEETSTPGFAPHKLLPYKGKASVKGNQTNIEHVLQKVVALEAGTPGNSQAISNLLQLQKSMVQLHDKMKDSADRTVKMLDDTTTGLRPRVDRLETNIVPQVQAIESSFKKFNKEATGRLDDLELKFDHPDNGVLPRLRKMENSVVVPGSKSKVLIPEVAILKKDIEGLKKQVNQRRHQQQQLPAPADWQKQLSALQQKSSH